MEDLVRYAFYTHFGDVLMAVDETEMVNPIATGVNAARFVRNEETKLLELPGSEEWAIRMFRVQKSLKEKVQDLTAWRNGQEKYLTGLRDAILERAIYHDWCEEYEKFAEEWELLPREREYDVQVTIRVTAPTEDEAADLVTGQLGSLHSEKWYVDGFDVDVRGVQFNG